MWKKHTLLSYRRRERERTWKERKPINFTVISAQMIFNAQQRKERARMIPDKSIEIASSGRDEISALLNTVDAKSVEGERSNKACKNEIHFWTFISQIILTSHYISLELKTVLREHSHPSAISHSRFALRWKCITHLTAISKSINNFSMWHFGW